MNHRSSTHARVMIDARYLRTHTSGIGRYTENLVRELLELDDALELTLVTHPERPEPFAHPRVQCVTFPAPANSLRTRFTMTRSLDFSDVDLFHSPFNILPGALPVPAVFTLHDIMWLIDPAYCTDSRLRRAVTGTFYRSLIPRSVAQARRILTVSHHSREAIEDHFPSTRGRVHVTYNGLDPFFHVLPEHDAWATISHLVQPRSRFVLVVGQGSPYKNHAGAMAGFIEAFADDPDVLFVMVRRFQRGPARELGALMSDPRVASRIITLEYVTGEQLRALYNCASAFCFPSFYEGFGLPPLEAMACGTPVVTSNVGAPAEVCGEAAERVDPHDRKAIGEALRRVVLDPDHHADLRARGLAHAATYTWRRTAVSALSAYRLALGLSPLDDDGAPS